MYLKKIARLLFALTLISTVNVTHAQDFGLKFKNGKLTYTKDQHGNRILDFSYCGYRNSDVGIPNVKNVVFVSHTNNDASAIIQRAIDYVSSLKPDANGFRGAVLLDKGVFHLKKHLIISTSGVVLRGMDKEKTVLVTEGYDRNPFIKILGQGTVKYSDPDHITNSYLPVNDMTFSVVDASKYKVGDQIQLHRPCTEKWIKSLGCNIFGGGISSLGWKPGDIDIYWKRKITAINGNNITINAPLTMALDSQYGVTKVLKIAKENYVSECGIENMTLISAYDHHYPKDEDHCWTGISVENADNCWVRAVNFEHFSGNAVFLQPTSSQITVEDCIAKDPISEIGGYRRIVFYTMGQLNLFQRCYSEHGINDFAAGFAAPGPNAFVQCDSKESLSFSGAIDAWACGLLFDIVNIDGNDLSFRNLGQDKRGAGWSTANSMFWQCTASEIECYSPAPDAVNRAAGSWCQFQGNGKWTDTNQHIRPRSLFYEQLQERLHKDVSAQGYILPRVTREASSSPTVAVAHKLDSIAHQPRLTLEKWINEHKFTASTDPSGLMNADQIKISKPMKMKAHTPKIAIINGKITEDGKLITGGKLDTQWWSGKTRPNYLRKMKPGITRYVPGREGLGLTDHMDSVIDYMQSHHIAVVDHHYGLWYDRRRDDHERIRRKDGDVWAPFYEQPFGRSGIGTAWDGLSKYDLYRPNHWYWYRLKEYANMAEKKGYLLYQQNFFQHNILEAGAHWVDCPWRTANNINHTGFPEPVNFVADKRLFMADYFYDTTNPVRKAVYTNYIHECLNNFKDNDNVIQFISAEFTGPLHFVKFWFDVIGQWEKQTGIKEMVALSTTKDVQDSILKEPKRAALVNVIDIRYWHYRHDGTVYAPKGGLDLAPRQFRRRMKFGKVTFTEAYKAVAEYREKFPEKAVIYDAGNYPALGWAIFMAGGSCPGIPQTNPEFLKDAVPMNIQQTGNPNYKMLGKSGIGAIIDCLHPDHKTINIENGRYRVLSIDSKTGKESIIKKRLRINSGYIPNNIMVKSGIYWFEKL